MRFSCQFDVLYIILEFYTRTLPGNSFFEPVRVNSRFSFCGPKMLDERTPPPRLDLLRVSSYVASFDLCLHEYILHSNCLEK